MKVKLKNGDSFIEVDTDDIEENEGSLIEERNNLEDTIELKLNMEKYHETNGSELLTTMKKYPKGFDEYDPEHSVLDFIIHFISRRISNGYEK